MFYEVRVLDSNSNLKKIISIKELSKRHWVNFEKPQAQHVLPQLKKKKTQNN